MSKLLKRYKNLAVEKTIDIEGLWDNSLTEYFKLAIYLHEHGSKVH